MATFVYTKSAYGKRFWVVKEKGVEGKAFATYVKAAAYLAELGFPEEEAMKKAATAKGVEATMMDVIEQRDALLAVANGMADLIDRVGLVVHAEFDAALRAAVEKAEGGAA